MAKSKKLPLFWKIYIAVGVVLIVLIAATVTVFGRYIYYYEQTLPAHAMEQFIASKDDAYWKSFVKESVLSDGRLLEDKDALSDSISSDLLSRDFSFSKDSASYRDDVPAYTLLSGDYAIAVVSFGKSGTTSFGFPLWEQSGITACDDIISSNVKKLTVKAPAGAEISAGDVILSDEFITGTEKIAPRSPFDDDDTLPEYYIYTLEWIFSTPDIIAKLGSDTLAESLGTDDSVIFSMPESAYRSVSITVPSDSSVTVGGKPLTDDYIEARDIPYTADTLNNVFFGDDAPVRLRYRIDGLLTYPEITVKAADGSVQEPETSDQDFFIYGLPESMLFSVSVSVPIDASVTVNGVLLNDDFITAEKVPYAPISDVQLEKYCSGIPHLKTFSVTGLYGKPVVTATAADGYPLPLTLTDDKSFIFTYVPPASEELKTLHDELITSFIDTYITFITRGSHDTDLHLEAVCEYLRPNSGAHILMTTLRHSVGFNIPCVLKRREITTRDFYAWGDKCFSCTVDFSIHMTKKNKDIDDTINDMHLFFIKQTGSEGLECWKIAEILIG